MKQNWSEVKKRLKHCHERELLGIIQELYQLNKSNKDYLNLRFLAGNHIDQKEALLKKSINTIKQQWKKAYHDPYGYNGNTLNVKITPMKAPLITYKKAIGIDEGYLLLLTEYVISGHQFLNENCLEFSDSAHHSINVVAKALFEQIRNEPTHVKVLDKHQLQKLQAFLQEEAIEEVVLAYREVERYFNLTT